MTKGRNCELNMFQSNFGQGGDKMATINTENNLPFPSPSSVRTCSRFLGHLLFEARHSQKQTMNASKQNPACDAAQRASELLTRQKH